MAYDWSWFSQTARIKVPAQKVYDAWATAANMETWFLRNAWFYNAEGKEKGKDEHIEVGDKYLWHWHGYPDGASERGEILEANGKDLLKFTFGKAGIVTVKLTEQPWGTLLEIKQENIPTDEQSKVSYHLGCSTGWTLYRANLKAVLENTTDVRYKDDVNAYSDI